MRTLLLISLLACALPACSEQPELVIEVTKLVGAGDANYIRVCDPETRFAECQAYQLFQGREHERVAVRSQQSHVWIYVDRGSDGCVGLDVNLERIASFSVMIGAGDPIHDCIDACTVRSCLDALP